MTIEVAAVNYLVLLFAVAGFGAACSGLRSYQRDSFRQKSFAIRDRLFDYAAAGHVSFNDPAYWELRLNINRVIQYSHRLNFGEALLPLMVHRRREQEPAPSYLRWCGALKEQPEAVRAELDRFHAEFQRAMITHLVLTTPLVWICLLPFALMGNLRAAIQRLVARAWVIEEEAQREAEVRFAQLA